MSSQNIPPTEHGNEGLQAAEVIVPVLKRIGDRKYCVVGTAFFVTRYGLLLTVRHVVDELVTSGGFILQQAPNNLLLQRRAISASVSNSFDIAAIQVENELNTKPPRSGSNRLVALSLEAPPEGADLVAWSYPENKVLDFTDVGRPPVMKAGHFYGKFLAKVEANERPFLKYPHYETTLDVRSGASGSPVGYKGRVIGIASRSWTFADPSEVPLSSVLPISLAFSLEVACAIIPLESWEYQRIPAHRRGAILTFGELVAYGHVNPFS